MSAECPVGAETGIYIQTGRSAKFGAREPNLINTLPEVKITSLLLPCETRLALFCADSLSERNAFAFLYMYSSVKDNHHCIMLSRAFSIHAKEGIITVQVIRRAFVALGIAVPSGPASRKENATRRIVSPQSGQSSSVPLFHTPHPVHHPHNPSHSLQCFSNFFPYLH